MNIVITGVSRGVGYQLAKQFLNDGQHTVIGMSRDAVKMNELYEQAPGNFLGIVCDITNEESLKSAAAIIEKKMQGRVDALINNAGLLIKKPFEELTGEDWRRVYEVNVFGVVSTVRLLLPMLQKGELYSGEKIRSHVVNISSMGGVQGSMKFRGLSAYSSSKGALITLGECMAEEMKPWGIRVNTVALGSVETEMFASAFPGIKAASKPVEIAGWLKDFSLTGCKFYNGKVLMMSTSTP